MRWDATSVIILTNYMDWDVKFYSYTIWCECLYIYRNRTTACVCLTNAFKALLDETTILVISRCCWWAVVDILTSGLSLEGEWNLKRSPVLPPLEKCVKRLVSYMLYFYTIELLFFLTHWATPQMLRCIWIQNLGVKCAFPCLHIPGISIFNTGPNTMLPNPISSVKSSILNGQWESERT